MACSRWWTSHWASALVRPLASGPVFQLCLADTLFLQWASSRSSTSCSCSLARRSSVRPARQQLVSTARWWQALYLSAADSLKDTFHVSSANARDSDDQSPNVVFGKLGRK